MGRILRFIWEKTVNWGRKYGNFEVYINNGNNCHVGSKPRPLDRINGEISKSCCHWKIRKKWVYDVGWIRTTDEEEADGFRSWHVAKDDRGTEETDQRAPTQFWIIRELFCMRRDWNYRREGRAPSKRPRFGLKKSLKVNASLWFEHVTSGLLARVGGWRVSQLLNICTFAP